MDDRTISRRADELLERVQLHERVQERVESYSRGMKQRLHIAKTLIHDPGIVILDEPTIGLDPGAAIGVRELIADLVPDHTVLLTTHDMHEADLLCREIAIVDQGLIVAGGTPEALKAATAIDRRVVITITDDAGYDRPALESRLGELSSVIAARHQTGDTGQTRLELACVETTNALDATLALLRERGAGIAAIDIREPSLEDAFLLATGREFEIAGASDTGQAEA
jgi:ABC-2 type transport system ATP-binding protein